MSAKETESPVWPLPASPFAMWIFDPLTGAIVAANEAAVHAYGYSYAELLACCVQDLCQLRDPHGGFMPTLQPDAWPWTGTVKQRRKGGAEFEADIAMFETSNEAHVALMVVMNPIAMTTGREGEVSSMKRTDVATQDQPAEAPTTRSKTLLGRATPISWLSDPAPGPQRRGHADRAEDSGSPESKRAHDRRAVTWGATEFVAVEARELARQVRERLRVRAAEKNSHVFVDCTCGRVWVQPQAFSEALYELLDNAVRATRKCHPVIVDACDTAEGDVLWQVQDAGDGMSDRTLAELGQSPQATWAEGSGNGVAFARAVIERHGGLLRFETASGVGTTASIWLPGARERVLAEKILQEGQMQDTKGR
jgi:histidine kinase/DNA gyrase B/HSP90-like ATPase